MTIAFMECSLYVLGLAVERLPKSSAGVVEQCSTGSVDLNKVDSPDFRKHRVLDDQVLWTMFCGKGSDKISVNLLLHLVILRTSGMESCLVITWPKSMMLNSVFGNAKDYFTNWDSVSENHAPSLLELTLKPKSDIKKLRRLAKRNDLDLWFEDECHFQQHGSRCAMWVPPEDTDPFVLQEPTRKGLGVFGAVCPADGRLSIAQADSFCAETFLDFLKQLFRRRRKGHKMVIILDNARWHHAKAIKPWIKERRKYLRLDFLPPYSPELNCIERVWKLTRRLRTHNQYFSRLEDLVETVLDQFRSWQKPNQLLQRLCAVI